MGKHDATGQTHTVLEVNVSCFLKDLDNVESCPCGNIQTLSNVSVALLHTNTTLHGSAENMILNFAHIFKSL